MSYSFWLSIDTGGPVSMTISPEFSDRHPELRDAGFAGIAKVGPWGASRCGNYTSNVAPIWQRCLIGAGQPDVPFLRDFDGALAANVAPVLERAVAWGVAHLPELRELNPTNGWGNAEGAITFLWDIQRLCAAHPRATLRFSY